MVEKTPNEGQKMQNSLPFRVIRFIADAVKAQEPARIAILIASIFIILVVNYLAGNFA